MSNDEIIKRYDEIIKGYDDLIALNDAAIKVMVACIVFPCFAVLGFALGTYLWS